MPEKNDRPAESAEKGGIPGLQRHDHWTSGRPTGAIFDPRRRYRYLLWRSWNPRRPRLAFVLLNPSRADETADDPTLRRCLGFARSWGFGSLEVVNLFARRGSDPALLRRAADPVGPDNDAHIQRTIRRCDCCVPGWGNGGRLLARDRAVLALAAGLTPLHCLGRTAAGNPRHPLYIPRSARPMRFVGDR